MHKCSQDNEGSISHVASTSPCYSSSAIQRPSSSQIIHFSHVFKSTFVLHGALQQWLPYNQAKNSCGMWILLPMKWPHQQLLPMQWPHQQQPLPMEWPHPKVAKGHQCHSQRAWIYVTQLSILNGGIKAWHWAPIMKQQIAFAGSPFWKGLCHYKLKCFKGRYWFFNWRTFERKEPLFLRLDPLECSVMGLSEGWPTKEMALQRAQRPWLCYASNEWAKLHCNEWRSQPPAFEGSYIHSRENYYSYIDEQHKSQTKMQPVTTELRATCLAILKRLKKHKYRWVLTLL